jgi:hypothetical protein
VTQGSVALGWLDTCIPWRYLPGVANNVFNGMEAVTSCHLATSRACAARWRVAVHHEWATVLRYTIVACYEWPVDRHCPVAVMQTPYPYVLLAFNVLPATCLACTQYRPFHVVSWKICARPNGRS